MAAPEDNLNEIQLGVLSHFQDITGMEDVDECTAILERHQWDIETAVQDTFNKAEGAATVFHEEPNEVDSPPLKNGTTGSSNVVAANTERTDQAVDVHRPNMGWCNWMFSILLLPFRFTSSVVTNVFSFIMTLVWPSFYYPRRTALDDVLHFKKEFEEKYGTVHPNFYQGTYSQVLNDAKRELRFVLVYLHSDDHQHTPAFCRSTMMNSGFIEYVNGCMLFWAVDVRSAEGYRVSNALRETTYPFLALICLRDNRMTVVGRMEGIMPVDRYVSILAQLVADNEPALIAARVERQERSQTQTLRDEQDQAYHESLKADKEKERRKLEEQEKKRKEEEAIRLKEQASQNKLESIARSRVEKREQLPEEPSPSDPDVFRVLVRLANGTRLERYFLKSHKLQTLYDFVFCNEEAPAEFRLSSPLPKKVYELNNPDYTLEDVGICSSVTLYVQDTTEDSDSD
ncbi:FAS-associated factor 2-like [Actinia tenebrosa]|uniref:FAS-associated factor 2-like n=1 Tax=Actinia tenebrosa TaxID=6105 RepID=A0A6P8IXJ5_ACTTE|nr:FAS-associated factor 2-like [Actinia tenebrosa]